MWSQVYNPTGNAVVSTLIAAIPVFILLGGLGFFNMRAHYCPVNECKFRVEANIHAG